MVRLRRAWAIAVGAVLLSACSGGGGAAPSPSGPTESPPATTSSPTAAATLLGGGKLAPGTYVADDFGTSLTFTVGKGWQVFRAEPPAAGQTQEAAFFALVNSEQPAASIAFVLPTRVVDPGADWNDSGNLIPVPADLIAWFAEHPMIQAEAPFATTVGALDAKAIDTVVIDVPKNGWPGCGGQCVLTIPVVVEHEQGPVTPSDPIFAAGLGEYDRLIVVTLGGQQLLIDIGAPDKKSFDAFLPIAEDLLQTVAFG